MFTGVDGDFTFRGGFDIVIVDAAITAVTETEAGRPARCILPGPPYPNPFNAGVVVPLLTGSDGDMDIAVYSLGGQRLVRLHTGGMSARNRRLRWDGRAGGGRAAASGVYLVRAVAGDWHTARKVLLLR